MQKKIISASIKLYESNLNQQQIVYYKRHLACKVEHLQKTTFLLPLNVPYNCKTIKFAVGTRSKSLHT